MPDPSGSTVAAMNITLTIPLLLLIGVALFVVAVGLEALHRPSPIASGAVVVLAVGCILAGLLQAVGL